MLMSVFIHQMLLVRTNRTLICEMGPYLTYIPGHVGLVKGNSIQGQILIR